PTAWKSSPTKSLSEARIGFCKNFLGRNAAMDAQFQRVKTELEAAGATVVEVEFNTNRYGAAEWEILQYEFKHDLNAYLERYGHDGIPRTLEALIAFNQENAVAEMPYFGQEIFESCQAKGPLTDSTYLEALATAKKEAAGQIDQLMDEHQLDALIGPTRS
ncbi:amidase family protein, partial [Arthrospira platensis SPKY1]|nr:amidase family protein [Arthrospira platensis SPKY1]